MIKRLKSVLSFRRDPGDDPLDEDRFYVAGTDSESRPIPHSVRIHQVDESLDHTDFQWACTGCGECCKGPGVVYFTERDLDQIRQLLRLDSSDWDTLYRRLIQKKVNGLYVHDTARACIFLGNDSRCKIYSARPLQCRTYPFWTSCFQESAGYRSLREFCPGTRGENRQDGNGYSAPEITIRVNRTADEFNRSQTSKRKSLYL